MVRVAPDVPAIHRAFDYAVPAEWAADGRADDLHLGAMVRIELHGRRVGGWVTEVDPDPQPGVTLRPLAKLSGVGPTPEVLDLCRWAAWRWAGALAPFLRTASPPRMLRRLPSARPSRPVAAPADPLVTEAFSGSGAIVRVAPLGDRWPFVLGAVARGNALVLTPSADQAATVVGRLRRLGVNAGSYDRDWVVGAAGGTMVGTRAAAFAPVADLAAVVVIDEHDEVYQSESAPTWHAREVVLERARRAGVPCVLTSPMPTVEAVEALPLLEPDRASERAGWPAIRAIDPREDGSARGTLWTEDAVRALREAERSVVVLNRRGRSKLLACKACDALAVCDQCDGALQQAEDPAVFVCARNGHERPVVCASCGSTTFKNLRIGVARAREELEALLRRPVVEITGDASADIDHRASVFVGTEAVLHRIDAADLVVFADFDQELLAPRYRASEQALALVVRAGRLVGGRRERKGGSGAGLVLIQSRQPTHPVVQAAERADVARIVTGEAARRKLLRYPPYAALAEVSGAGASDYMERLGTPLGLDIRARSNPPSWQIRADDSVTLADALATVTRPKGRLRVAVDPLRA